MYKVVLLPEAERSLIKLDKAMRLRVADKIDWLSANAERIIHHPLTSLPEDLKGLCRIRVGDYRIIYWNYTKSNIIKIYDIEHRGRKYRSIKR